MIYKVILLQVDEKGDKVKPPLLTTYYGTTSEGPAVVRQKAEDTFSTRFKGLKLFAQVEELGDYISFAIDNYET